MIRPAHPAETEDLLEVAVATGLFTPEEARRLLRRTLDELHAGHLGEQHFAYVSCDGVGEPANGWVYFSASTQADGVWDLWWIGVRPSLQSSGVGTSLLDFVEQHIGAAGGRVVIIETSSLPALTLTRAFYRRRGYRECGKVPNFYGDGDDKVTFAKSLPRAP